LIKPLIIKPHNHIYDFNEVTIFTTDGAVTVAAINTARFCNHPYISTQQCYGLTTNDIGLNCNIKAASQKQLI